MTEATRTVSRVIAVTRGEAENSTDVDFKAKLDSSLSAIISGKRIHLMNMNIRIFWHSPGHAMDALIKLVLFKWYQVIMPSYVVHFPYSHWPHGIRRKSCHYPAQQCSRAAEL